MAASSSRINMSKLTPTESYSKKQNFYDEYFTRFHSLRTYLQVWEWKTLKDGPLLEVTD